MDIDIKSKKVGLKQINNFYYNVGDCLFDAIIYLLKYSIRFRMTQKNSMSHLQKCLMFGTLQTLECRRL